jgi:hypothetical protein
MQALEFVNTVANTLQERGDQYGPIRENVDRIAAIAYLISGEPVDPLLVVKVLVAVKLSRLAQDARHLDSVVDLAGYSAIWAELISEPALNEPVSGV